MVGKWTCFEEQERNGKGAVVCLSLDSHSLRGTGLHWVDIVHEFRDPL